MIYRGALDAVHLVKDFFLLAFDHYADLFSESSQFICHVTKRLLHLIGVNDHHHIDISQTIVQGYFNMMMIVDTNQMQKTFGDMADELAVLGEEIGVVIKCQKEEIFDKMHRI